MTIITIHEDVRELMRELNELGESIIFGGYLRSRYFNEVPNDVDIATKIPIEVLEEKYNHMEKARKRKTTSGYDVYSFKMNRSEKIFVEIVCTEDNLFDKSKFADYTINSLLHDGERVIDLQNGLEDINKEIIKEVDIEIIKRDLKTRPFLWLKTLRLVSMTGFDLSKITFEVLKENKDCIKSISPEIMQSEGHKTLNGRNPFKAMELLARMNFIAPFRIEAGGVIKNKSYSIQSQQQLCLLAILSNKQTIDDYVRFYHFQQDLIDKYERLYQIYISGERPPSRFKNHIINIKKIIGEIK